MSSVKGVKVCFRGENHLIGSSMQESVQRISDDRVPSVCVCVCKERNERM